MHTRQGWVSVGRRPVNVPGSGPAATAASPTILAVGEGTTASDGRSGDIDRDAPWRPGFDGWDDDRPVEPAGPTLTDRVAAQGDVDLEPWSREHDQAEPEPWVPDRRTRAERYTKPARKPAGRPIATVEGQPTTAVTGLVVLTGMVIVAGLLVAGALAVAIRPPARPAPVVGAVAPIVPEQAEERWSHEFDEPIGIVALGGGHAFVYLTSPQSVVAFDLDTGAETWSHPIDLERRSVDRIAVIGDRVLVRQGGLAGNSSILALDLADGTAAWSVTDDADYQLVGPDHAALVVRATSDDPDDRALRLELVDPVDGTIVGPSIQEAELSVPGSDELARRRSEREVTLWSFEGRADVAGPFDPFGLRWVAAVDDAIVALDEGGRIVAFDPAGVRTDERPFVSDAFGEFTGRATLSGVVPDQNLGIIASGSSLGFQVVDGQIRAVWQRAGRALEPVPTEVGPVSVLVGPAPETGEINDSLIDALTGETIGITDDGGTRESEPVLGHNAYLAAPEIGAAERVLTARRYDGSELWTLPLRPFSSYSLESGVVLLVDRTSTPRIVTVIG